MNDIVDIKTGKPVLDEIKSKAEASKKRAAGKHNFYVKARISTETIKVLKEALMTSSVCDDNGNALIPWTKELIDELTSGVTDPGPKNKNRDS